MTTTAITVAAPAPRHPFRAPALPAAAPVGRRASEDRGGATLVGLGLAGLILVTGLVAVDVGALAVARAAAQTAADLAALAALAPEEGQALPADGAAVAPGKGRALPVALGPGEARAAEIAAANGAELVVCSCSTVQAVVTVRRRLRLVPGGLIVSVTATARAVLGNVRA